MAKNILDQLLSLTGIKSPDANGYYDPSVYRDEPTPKKEPRELTRVEKHLRKKNSVLAQASKGATGVEKYLAQKQQKAESETSPLTGVAKYLAQKQKDEQDKTEAAALENMTGVARYLAKLEATHKSTPSKPVQKKTENIAPLTGVDKYLAHKKTTAPIIPPPEVIEETPEDLPPVKETNTSAKEEIQAEKTQEPDASVTTNAETTEKLINMADKATQCQAATLKGTQCRRKTNLDVLEKTVNQQKYKFAVCSQHNNSDFIPFSKFLQD